MVCIIAGIIFGFFLGSFFAHYTGLTNMGFGQSIRGGAFLVFGLVFVVNFRRLSALWETLKEQFDEESSDHAEGLPQVQRSDDNGT